MSWLQLPDAPQPRSRPRYLRPVLEADRAAVSPACSRCGQPFTTLDLVLVYQPWPMRHFVFCPPWRLADARDGWRVGLIPSAGLTW